MLDRYIPDPTAICRNFADGAVVYSPGSESYFGLNGTGVRVWGLLPKSGASLDELLQGMAAAYPEVPEDELRADLGSLLDELVGHGLIRRVGAGVAA